MIVLWKLLRVDVMLAFLVCAYVGSYLVLLKREEWAVCAQTVDGSTLFVYTPAFRIEHPLVSAAFVPLVQMDYCLRPSYWKPTRSEGIFGKGKTTGGFGGSYGGFGGSYGAPFK